MNRTAGLPEPVVLVAGLALIVACGCAGIAAILGVQPLAMSSRQRTLPLLEHEKDVAAALGWQWRRWVALRAGVTLAGIAVGVTTQIWLLSALLGVIGFFGVRFLVAGRAARRRLGMERAFLVQLRVLRDRMAIGNQSLELRTPGDRTQPRSRTGIRARTVGRGWIGHREHRVERTALSIGGCRARLCRSDLGENPKS